jgi:hypothetical protein
MPSRKQQGSWLIRAVEKRIPSLLTWGAAIKYAAQAASAMVERERIKLSVETDGL